MNDPGFRAQEASGDVIEALDHYYEDHGRYPYRFETLVPTYLPELPYDIDYRAGRLEESYALTFRYEDRTRHYECPYVFICYYASDTEQWDCTGICL
jgi:hypothetical protein